MSCVFLFANRCWLLFLCFLSLLFTNVVSSAELVFSKGSLTVVLSDKKIFSTKDVIDPSDTKVKPEIEYIIPGDSLLKTISNAVCKGRSDTDTSAGVASCQVINNHDNEEAAPQSKPAGKNSILVIAPVDSTFQFGGFFGKAIYDTGFCSDSYEGIPGSLYQETENRDLWVYHPNDFKPMGNPVNTEHELVSGEPYMVRPYPESVLSKETANSVVVSYIQARAIALDDGDLINAINNEGQPQVKKVLERAYGAVIKSIDKKLEVKSENIGSHQVLEESTSGAVVSSQALDASSAEAVGSSPVLEVSSSPVCHVVMPVILSSVYGFSEESLNVLIDLIFNHKFSSDITIYISAAGKDGVDGFLLKSLKDNLIGLGFSEKI